MKLNLPELTGPAGAAFLLRTPSKKSFELQHPEGLVTIREGANYVSITLHDPTIPSSIRSNAWRVVQEAFDLRAVTHREALTTRNGEREYILWNQVGDGYQLTCVDTLDLTWSASMQITTNAAIRNPTETTLHPHPSMRFYRLSQLSDDLFDAYRNAYLCLECLVSDTSPQAIVDGKKEKELQWLKRVLNNNLAAAFPQGFEIDKTISEIYKKGRSRLFHAGSNFYHPQGADREIVQALFEKLTYLLILIFRYKFGDSLIKMWGGMSTGASDLMVQTSLQFDELILIHDDQRLSIVPTIEIVDSPRRFGQLWAKISCQLPGNSSFIAGINMMHHGEVMVELEFADCLPMTKVLDLTVELNTLQYNAYAPNPSHAE